MKSEEANPKEWVSEDVRMQDDDADGLTGEGGLDPPDAHDALVG